MTDLYEKIKKDIATAFYQDQFSNDGQRFDAWYLRNIYNLSASEALDCITDGAGDKQIDAVYIDDDNSTVHIIQGKFYSSGAVNSEPLREVLASWQYLKDLPALQENANDRLKAKIKDIADALQDDYEIMFELITPAGLTESAKADAETFNKQLVEDDTLSANLFIVDKDTLSFRYDEALNRERPYINHDFELENNKFMVLDLDGTQAVIAAIPLKECIQIPGIKDGSLFRKNVRQSLGNSNKVNKGIARTLKNDAKNFFFFHNGITAICSKLELDGNILHAKELNVVNGCQSLNTIYNSSESVKSGTGGYIMFKFYEITDPVTSDKITTNTNSQSAVKARDLRSNDKNVLALKKAYENRYPDGYFKTKRGEKVNEAKYNTSHIVDLTDLGKELIAWQSQRPTISYSETRIFDKYFNQLFDKDYDPEKIQALNDLFRLVKAKWTDENPMDLNQALLALKSYAPYHHLYAVSAIFCELSKMPSTSVPNPAKAFELLQKNNLTDMIVTIAGTCLNTAFENARNDANENNRVFSPQNWTKNKGSLKNIREAVSGYFKYMKSFDTTGEYKKMKSALSMNTSDFEDRWSAD